MEKGELKMIEKTFVLNNEEGLHARPASVFAQACMKFTSDLKLFKNGNREKVYQPKSVLSIMTIGAAQGDQVTIVADGVDEVEVMEKLTILFDTNFEV